MTIQAQIREMPAQPVQPMRGAVPRISAVASQNNLFGSVELSGVPMSFERDAEIYGEGEPTDYVYKVLTGAVRTYKVLNDGRRQISAFYLPGDVFGLESGEEHGSSAEAVTETSVLLVRRSLILKSAERSAEIARRLWSVTGLELKRSQEHALLLIKSAQERLAAFLLEMAGRLVGKSAVELPMSRQDIADYLGLTIETVSRTLTQFAGSATIELVASRRIVLRDRSALSQLNS